MRLTGMLKPLSGFVLTVLCSSIYAQNPKCGFDPLHNRLTLQNKKFQKAVSSNEFKIQDYMQRTMKLDGSVYTIPVVVHVIHKGEAIGTGTNISNNQIQSAITAMTQHYRGTLGSSVDTEIEFVLASIDPNCSASSGIVRIDGRSVSGYDASGLTTDEITGNEVAVKNLSRWSNNKYYNIWIVSEIDGNNGGAGVQGFAYFPGAPAELDGAVMLYNAFGYDPAASLGYNLKSYTNMNTVVTHEMGHALGLYHTFQGDDTNNDGVADACPANTTCTTQGDRVCDTDPHQRSASVCPAGATANACNGGLPLGTIVNNYMDYSSEACQDRFTAGQVARMRAYLEVLRPGLALSTTTDPYPYGAYTPPVAACAPVTGPDGISAPYAGIMNVTVNNTSFSSATTYLDGGYVDGTNCLNIVPMIAGGNYTIEVTVQADPNYEQVRAWIDFNNDGVFSNATEQLIWANDIPPTAGGYVTVSTNFTVPGTAVQNTNLRLRVLNELGTIHGGVFSINSACYNPEYGQAEDYIARISGVLPVSLTEFKGSLQNKAVVLDWKTTQEINSGNYEVQRSSDGENFFTIGTVDAAGNSQSTLSYSFTDARAGAVNHYRLKMNDRDGQFKYSQVVLIRNNGADQNIWVTKNPFRSHIELRLARKSDQVKLQLINASGALVAEKQFTNVSEIIQWEIPSQLSRSIYFLKIISDGQVFTEKLVKE